MDNPTETGALLPVTLKPCPFCGGEAERFTIGEGEPDNAGGDVITCTRCQASSHVEFGRKENLVDRWNTRQSETGAALTSDGVEMSGCNYCGAQVALMGADYLEQLAAALDKVGAPRKSPDGNEHYGLEKRIAALAQPASDGRESLREALAEAYRKGATDVHSYWVNNPGEPPQGDPEFGEAASDYAMSALDPFDSSARAALAQPVEAGEDGCGAIEGHG